MIQDWQFELDRAQRARLEGNEGRARVCARRAAGIAGRKYLKRKGIHLQTSSIFDALHSLELRSDLAPDLQVATSHLLLRVNEEFVLPFEVDLIADAMTLIKGLENHE
jgi:hypothetical protein